MKKNIKQSGSSFVEVVLAVGIFSVIAASIGILVISSLVAGRRSGEQTEAVLINQQASEALRVISEQAWNYFAFRDDGSLHGIDNGGGSWVFSGTSNTIGKYTRTIDVNEVQRDGGGDVNVGTSDLETKEVVVTTSWTNAFGQAVSESSTYYLTNWGRNLFTETTDTDFNDGVFTNTTTTTASDGEVVLSTTGGGGGAGSSSFDWTFTNGGDYSFDSAKIEVTGDTASLVESSSSSNITADPGFDTVLTWSGNCWDLQPQETCVPLRQLIGGNPSAFGEIALTSKKNRQVGGFWQQSFTTTTANPDILIDLDYLVSTLSIGANDSVTLYAFVDSAAGAPTIGTEVWSQTINSTAGWTSATTFTDNDNITTPGTYYLKVALWLNAGNAGGNPTRTATAGFDNVQLYELAGGGTFPSDNPSINPNTSWAPSNLLINWSSFSETATKNSGEIYYQLSSDNGSTWQYWDGAAWSAAGANDYSTAASINTNIASFDASSGQITFRAFLESDGSFDVILDNVQIEAQTEEVTMEAGTVNTDETWATVNTAQTYTNPVVVAFYEEQTASPTNDAYSVSARVRNAGASSFQIRIEDPAGNNLNPADISYLVMEEGTWTVGSTLIEAHKENISTVANDSSWVGDNKTYNHTFSSSPLVLHQVMSDNDPLWIESWVSAQGDRTNPPTTSGFQLALNSAEVTSSDTHGAEDIGWIAIQAGQDDTVDTIPFITRITGDSIRGHQNGCDVESFGTTLTNPIIIGDQQKMDDADGGWLVECSKSTTSVGIHVEEDQEANSERNHNTEIAAYIAFDQAFSVNGSGGSGYVLSGTYESSDFGIANNFNLISWAETLPSNTDIQVQIKTAPDNSGSPGVYTATWSGPEGDDGDETDFFTINTGELIHPDHVGDQWIKYRITLTSDGVNTPVVENITINYR